MSKYIVFYNQQGKKLVAYTEYGTFAGELEATKELLAYDNGIPVDEIVVKVEERKG